MKAAERRLSPWSLDIFVHDSGFFVLYVEFHIMIRSLMSQTR